MSCCSSPRTQQRCHKHADCMLILFCIHKSCLQPLCIRCRDQHEVIHHNMEIGQAQIIQIRDLQDYFQQTVNTELQMLKQAQNKVFKPEKYFYNIIDQYFHGSSKVRQNVLISQKKEISNDYTAKVLIGLIQRGHEYNLGKDFKQKYHDFLKGMLDEIERDNSI